MSDAQAAQVTENGVPPTAQDKVEETPGFKVFPSAFATMPATHSCKVFAGNLAYSTTEDGLKAFFDIVQDDVLSVQVITRGQQSAGYGFVALATEEAAQKAVDALNKKELDGRSLIVEIAKPADQKDKRVHRFKRRISRRGGKAVPGEVTEAEADGEAPKAEEITSGTNEAAKPKKKKKKPARKPRAKAEGATEAVEFAAGAEGEAAPKESPPNARKPRRRYKPRTRPVGEDPVGEPSKNMLFVANLGFNIDDEGLSALFTEAGINVVSARIVLRRWGQPRKSKGYGFVDVGNEEEQKKAIETLQGMDVGGRPIAVKIAVNTTNEDTPDEAAPANVVAPAPAA
ncbi:Polyadenylate-binding protein 4 [Leucoagaricus sp. SymC.cos]|nr:Polyadenylate-binding protein 4 [Leucoagaricus sp. SymC.cos]